MTWRDVTAECEVDESSVKGLRILHNGADVLWDGTYRLTKISGPLKPHVAFIVEKQA